MERNRSPSGEGLNAVEKKRHSGEVLTGVLKRFTRCGSGCWWNAGGGSVSLREMSPTKGGGLGRGVRAHPSRGGSEGRAEGNGPMTQEARMTWR